jgi:hypothetical protein
VVEPGEETAAAGSGLDGVGSDGKTFTHGEHSMT